ncbi:MAG: sulfite exporter TauE/SafE family protein [Micrococcales bacterium]|nr:sulfite exporter TauE/SafE family protein [Micrococcales bacterium]
MTVLAIALAVLVGLTLGMLGGGGSILTVPLLVYVAGLDAKAAIATSLLVVGVTSAVGAVSHARAGRVQWRTGLIFGGAGMAGAYAGGRVAHYIPGEILLLAFAAMMIATSVAMLRGRREVDGRRVHDHLPVGRVLLDGVVVGLVTGLVGAGGGFLVVPALALLGGLTMPVAVGTSLVVIAIKSLGGLAGYLATVSIDWGLALSVTAAAVVGALAGGQLAGRIPPDLLRKVFGWFVLVMGTLIVAQELPREWLGASAVAALVLTILVVAGFAVLRRGRSTETAAEPRHAEAAGHRQSQ